MHVAHGIRCTLHLCKPTTGNNTEVLGVMYNTTTSAVGTAGVRFVRQTFLWQKQHIIVIASSRAMVACNMLCTQMTANSHFRGTVHSCLQMLCGFHFWCCRTAYCCCAGRYTTSLVDTAQTGTRRSITPSDCISSPMLATDVAVCAMLLEVWIRVRCK
jgi:hypothetical protein